MRIWSNPNPLPNTSKSNVFMNATTSDHWNPTAVVNVDEAFVMIVSIKMLLYLADKLDHAAPFGGTGFVAFVLFYNGVRYGE